MSRELLIEFIKQYKNGWYIPENKEDVDNAWNMVKLIVNYGINTVGKYPEPEPECKDAFIDKSKFLDLYTRKMVIAMNKDGDDYLVYFFKYSDGIDMYRLLMFGFSNMGKVIGDVGYMCPIVFPFYKALIKHTNKPIYCLIGAYSDEKNNTLGEKYGMTGYRDEKLGWVWNV